MMKCIYYSDCSKGIFWSPWQHIQKAGRQSNEILWRDSIWSDYEQIF